VKVQRVASLRLPPAEGHNVVLAGEHPALRSKMCRFRMAAAKDF
jgi:hypothetical protein